MSVSDRQYELIHKFLSENISNSEMDELKENLKQDSFRSELEFQAQMIDALAELEKKKITDVKPSSNRVISLNAIYRVAAVAILLFGSIMVFQKFIVQKDYTHLVAKHSTSYPPEIFQRGDQKEFEIGYKEAMGYYANQNYELAYNIFLDLKPQTEKVKLFRANCLIELKKYDDAIQVLNNLKLSKTSDIQQNAEWYLAITYLLSENENEAKIMLRKISESTRHIFKEKSKALLKEL